MFEPTQQAQGSETESPPKAVAISADIAPPTNLAQGVHWPMLPAGKSLLQFLNHWGLNLLCLCHRTPNTEVLPLYGEVPASLLLNYQNISNFMLASKRPEVGPVSYVSKSSRGCSVAVLHPQLHSFLFLQLDAQPDALPELQTLLLNLLAEL